LNTSALFARDDKTDIPVARFLQGVGIGRSKYRDWIERFGKPRHIC
jgi:hypothetical protein